MTQQPDRPAALSRRPRPQPAPDDLVDPVSLRPETPATPQVPAPRRSKATVPLYVRIPEDVAARVDHAAASRGVSKREIIEQLVRDHLT